MLTQLVLAMALINGPVMPDDTNYWNGYAASVIAVPIVKGGQDVIHEGKPKPIPTPKPKHEEVPVAIPAPVKQEEMVKATELDLQVKTNQELSKRVTDLTKANEELTQETAKLKAKVDAVPAKPIEIVPPAPKRTSLTVEDIERLTPPPGFKITVTPLPPVAVPNKKVEEPVETVKPAPEIKSVTPAPTPKVKAEPPTDTPPYPLPVQPTQPIKVKMMNPKTVRDVVQYTLDNDCYAFILFSSKTCPPCVRMKKEIMPNQDLMEAMYAKNIKKIVYVYVENEKDIADYLQITSTPTAVVVKGNHVYKRGSGCPNNSGELIDWINK